MKIAIVSLVSRIGDNTGDMVQAQKTAEAIRSLGHDVVRCFFNQNTGEVFGGDGRELGQWEEIFSDRDIVHAIPPIPWKFIRGQSRLKAKLVCSTVFWRSYAYTKVIQKVDGELTVGMLKDYARTVLAWLGLPSYTSYYGYDLLLPNSEDEIRNFKRYCLLKTDAKIVAIPNAIDCIPDYVRELSRPEFLPKDDYILVPGVFAARKNQLSFIRAMYGSSYPIVFIGTGALLERCKSEASCDMRFLGHIQHGTPEFYGVMKYARVVCLPSNCETPGIAALEAAALGARPVVPYEGGTSQYFCWDAEYLNPLSIQSIRTSVEKAWRRGRLSDVEADRYARGTWSICAKATLAAYNDISGFHAMGV